MRAQMNSTKAPNVSSLTGRRVASVKCGLLRIRKWYKRLCREFFIKNIDVQRDPVKEVLDEFDKIIGYFEEEELQNIENENAENELRELAAKGQQI